MGRGTNSHKLNLVELKANEVKALAAYYYDGQSQEEIAADLRVSQAWVSMLLASGEKRLQEAGLPPPSRPPQARQYLCNGKYLDTLYRGRNGRCKPSGHRDSQGDS